MDMAPKNVLVKTVGSSLIERTRAVADLAENELRRFAVEATRDRATAALWALSDMLSDDEV